MESAKLGDLIDKCKSGDKSAWNMIIQLYSKSIFNIAYNFIGNRESAADITQEVFLKFYNHVEKIRDYENFEAWLFTVCRNCCIDFWRKNKKHLFVEEANENSLAFVASPEKIAISRSEIEFIRSLLAKLEPETRILIIMRDIQGFSYQQIAQKFSIPEGTVKSRINRARLKLASRYFSGVKKNGLH